MHLSKNNNLKILTGLLGFSLCFLIFASGVAGQSTLQDYPTPITTNEVKGVISARQIGDSRLTTHFYIFDGRQGDIFINVTTSNFAGDIDFFIEQGLRPLSKIVLYADNPVNETGRVIYLRKEERLLLRVQGRTPNDDPASYQIKFAGSFIALKKGDVQEVPEIPVVTSVATARSTSQLPNEQKSNIETAEENGKEDLVAETNRESQEAKRPVVPARTSVAQRPAPASQRRGRERQVDESSGFYLVVEFKDGGTINRSMTDVQRFTVDGGILTVIYKSGAVGRYPMSTVQRVGIEQSN